MKKYKNQVEEQEQLRLDRNNSERQSDAREVSNALLKTYGRGVVLSEIEAGSIAEELGLQPGDRLVQINEEPARDAIQWKMADSTEQLSITIISKNEEVQLFEIEKDAFEPVGIGIDSELFDGVKRCTNKCPFCFVDQLPPRVKNSFGAKDKFKNLRRTLYVRDDDYRLSFLHGHYITLTNLKDADYERIIREKLTPLCVSVHATDPETRIKMVGNKSAGNIMERLEFLIDNGIQVNTQIVLCPEVNDGAILERSIEDLMSLWPGVESMAIVPAGLTKWLPPERGLRTVRPAEAARILEQIKPFQRRAKEKFGARFVYASDEMYLLANQPVPGASYYDGFPQYANGVGTIRNFLDEVTKLKRKKAQQVLAQKKITLVTGTLASDALQELANVVNERGLAQAQVITIQNTFWGGNVGCAGLIMGEELLAQLKGVDCGEMIFLPPDAVDNQNRMLDDITLDELSAQLGTQVRCDASGPMELAQILAAS